MISENSTRANVSSRSSNSNDNRDSKTAANNKKDKNVFTYMDLTYKSRGPKSLLYKSIRENRRIKVWTRSHSYVRSICTGYLVAFDKFWNLAMKDVDEIYRISTNKLNDFSKQMSLLTMSSDKEESKEAKTTDDEAKTLIEEFNLYKSGRFNLFERHMNQLLIRGDNVVMVTLAD